MFARTAILATKAAKSRSGVRYVGIERACAAHHRLRFHPSLRGPPDAVCARTAGDGRTAASASAATGCGRSVPGLRRLPGDGAPPRGRLGPRSVRGDAGGVPRLRRSGTECRRAALRTPPPKLAESGVLADRAASSGVRELERSAGVCGMAVAEDGPSVPFANGGGMGPRRGRQLQGVLRYGRNLRGRLLRAERRRHFRHGGQSPGVDGQLLGWGLRSKSDARRPLEAADTVAAL